MHISKISQKYSPLELHSIRDDRSSQRLLLVLFVWMFGENVKDSSMRLVVSRTLPITEKQLHLFLDTGQKCATF